MAEGNAMINEATNEERISFTIAVAPTAPKGHAQEKISKHRDKAREDDRDRHHENIAVSYVREFVRYHAFQFRLLESLQKPCGDRNHRMLFIAPLSMTIMLMFLSFIIIIYVFIIYIIFNDS